MSPKTMRTQKRSLKEQPSARHLERGLSTSFPNTQTMISQRTKIQQVVCGRRAASLARSFLERESGTRSRLSADDVTKCNSHSLG